MTNLQVTIEQQRHVISHLKMPLLAQICKMHGLTVRDVAKLFGISKTHAAKVINHTAMPSLHVAFRMSRYFECRIEDLWGWMISDLETRRPMVMEVGGQLIRLKAGRPEHSVMGLIRQLSDELKKQEEQKTPQGEGQ